MLERTIPSSSERVPVIPATETASHLRENLSAGDGRLATPSECRELVEFLGT